MKIDIDSKANFIIHTLQNSGFEAYAVGGCVRNALLGLVPNDWDICTNALPEQMREVFRGFQTLDFGLKHGTLAVLSDGEKYEVTTYRIDGAYADNRHPESVTFTGELALDLSRRDFTVNAMAYSDELGLADPFGGAEDLKRNLLRCVGNPDNRFHEDALRILRGLRFASAYGFTVESKTAKAIHRNAVLLHNIAGERIREELLGILCGAHVAEVLTEFRDVIAVVIPELSETFDFEQRTKHHCYDVWQHIVHAVAAVENQPVLRVAMLLHDIGKPRACTTDGTGCNHFKGHQEISAQMAEEIFRRLHFSNDFSQTCLQLIRCHDVRFNGSAKQVRRVLQALGEDNMHLLFSVQRADLAAQSDYRREEKLAAVDTAQRQFEEILAQNQCFSLKQLAVDGNDILSLGAKGREVGNILNLLLDEVIEERLPNEREALLDRAGEALSGK